MEEWRTENFGTEGRDHRTEDKAYKREKDVDEASGL